MLICRPENLKSILIDDINKYFTKPNAEKIYIESELGTFLTVTERRKQSLGLIFSCSV